jgi:hypothetical protein
MDWMSFLSLLSLSRPNLQTDKKIGIISTITGIYCIHLPRLLPYNMLYEKRGEEYRNG